MALDQEERIYRYQKSEMVSRIYNNIWMQYSFVVFDYLTQSTSIFRVMWRC